MYSIAYAETRLFSKNQRCLPKSHYTISPIQLSDMAPLPDQELRVADRTELFDDPQDDNDNDSIPEDGAQRMDMLMQQLLGSDQNDQEDQEDQEDQSMVDATPSECHTMHSACMV